MKTTFLPSLITTPPPATVLLTAWRSQARAPISAFVRFAASGGGARRNASYLERGECFGGLEQKGGLEIGRGSVKDAQLRDRSTFAISRTLPYAATDRSPYTTNRTYLNASSASSSMLKHSTQPASPLHTKLPNHHKCGTLFSSSFLPASQPNPQLHRTFTSTTHKMVWKLWRPKSQRKPAVPNAGHQPPLASFLEDNGGPNGLGRVTRPTNELKLRCTELDEHGNVTMVSGEFKKSELIAKVREKTISTIPILGKNFHNGRMLNIYQYGLLTRDLRKIDSSLLPHILVRPSAILINLLHLRVLIKHNRVLVFDAYGTSDSYSQSVFMYDLDLKLRQKDSPANGILPYEFRALEAVLISVTLGLESEFEGVSEPVVRVLRELEEDIDRDKLRYLLIYSKKLGTFEQKARLVRDALTELLEADDDLSAMYLTEKAEGRIRGEDDHTEVEMLLESYHKVADEIVQAAENLVSSIRNTEEMYAPHSFPPPLLPYLKICTFFSS